MYKKRLEMLQAAAREQVQIAKSVAKKADDENRAMTAAERATYDAAMKGAEDGLEQIKSVKEDQEIWEKAKAMLGGATPNDQDIWVKETVTQIRNAMSGMGDGHYASKALVSGTIPVTDPVFAGIAALPTAPRTVLDLLRGTPAGQETNEPYAYQSVQELHASLFGGGTGNGGNTFSFTRQTLRTNNAAVVGDNATKPTSLYEVKAIEDHYRVVAHLSEPVPQRLFDDDGSLGAFLGNEMANGLARAVETQVLNGDGTPLADASDTNMTGLLNTSGLLSQAWATDTLTTSRKALTALQSAGVTPTAWVLHPSDAETFDLLRDGTGNGAFLLGGPGANAGLNLWSIPRVTSLAVTPGAAILGDWTGAQLVTRQGATLHIDTGGGLFEKNQVRFRMEGRYGIAVKMPRNFVTVDLTAA